MLRGWILIMWIPNTLRIVLCIAVIVYFIIILFYLKKKMLELKYTLLWLLAGAVMGVLVIWPQLLMYFVKLIGVQSAMNGLYLVCIGFIIIILMSITSIVSRTTMKMRVLLQEMSMLEKRIRDLEGNSEKENEKK